MDGRQKSDAQSESANDQNNNEVIDLTQVIQEGKNDDVIDLTNVLDQPKKDPDALNETTDPSLDTDDALTDFKEADMDEEGLIDFAEMEKTLEVDIAESLLEEDENEDAIDLAEAATPDAALDADLNDDSKDDEEEDIIDLAEAAIPDAAVDADLDDEGKDDDEDIIDLMEAATPETAVDADLDDEGKDDDEDIIDLMEAATPEAAVDADLDEIADLDPTSAVSPPDPLESAEIIDLNLSTESIPADENIDDDIINLAVMEEALETDLSDTLTDDSQDDEEEALDLLDSVEPDIQAVQEDNATDSSPSEPPLFADTLDTNEEIDIPTTQDTGYDEDLLAPDEYDNDDDIIDLAEMEAALDTDTAETILDDDHKEDENVIDLLSGAAPKTLEAIDGKDETRDVGLPLDTIDEKPPHEESPAAPPVSLSEDQIEAALERTIRNIYGEKIEQLMIQTIEKTVLQEIAKIKQALMENDDDVSN